MIDVWSDIVCPWCYVGREHLLQAIANANLPGRTEVRHHAFQLEPTRRHPEPLKQRLERKFGASYQAVTDRVSAAAARVGLTLDFEHGIAANTHRAHELVRRASWVGRGDAAAEALMRAHFAESLDVSDVQTLQRLARDLGLAPVDDRSPEALRAKAEVDADLDQARAFGISGVPFFVFNQRLAVAGAQPIGVFEAAIQKALDEAPEKP